MPGTTLDVHTVAICLPCYVNDFPYNLSLTKSSQEPQVLEMDLILYAGIFLQIGVERSRAPFS